MKLENFQLSLVTLCLLVVFGRGVPVSQEELLDLLSGSNGDSFIELPSLPYSGKSNHDQNEAVDSVDFDILPADKGKRLPPLPWNKRLPELPWDKKAAIKQPLPPLPWKKHLEIDVDADKEEYLKELMELMEEWDNQNAEKRLPPLPWNKRIPPLPWNKRIPPLPWNKRVPELPWDKRIPSLPWNKRIPPLPWNKRIPSLPWNKRIPPLPWNKRIPPLPWNKRIPPLPWNKRIPALPWNKRIPPLPWNKRIPPLPWNKRIPSLPWNKRADETAGANDLEGLMESLYQALHDVEDQDLNSSVSHPSLEHLLEDADRS